MSNPVPTCTHTKTDGTRCGSPAVAGTGLCYHHSSVKTTLGKVPEQASRGEFAPIPFVFPEDRASMQINFFLLLQAFNEGRVDLRRYRAMMSMLKSMAANLGKTGSLVEGSVQGSAVSDQGGSEPTSQNRDVGHPHLRSVARESVALSAAAEKRGKSAVGPFSFTPDYGFLPSVQPWEVGAGSDPVREMARQAARARW